MVACHLEEKNESYGAVLMRKLPLTLVLAVVA